VLSTHPARRKSFNLLILQLILAAITPVLFTTDYASPAPEQSRVPVTIHYDPILVTRISYQDPKGGKTEHDPATTGVFNLKMLPGPGIIRYRTGEPFPPEPKMDSWYGATFNVSSRGLTELVEPAKTDHEEPLRRGLLKRCGDFEICIGVGPSRNQPGPVVSNSPQLFLDDYLIASMSGLKRRLNQPRKFEGNPLSFVAEYPWEQEGIMFHTVMFDSSMKKFRMWYSSYLDRKKYGDNYGRACYAESDDGISWRKPMLNICDFEGLLPTNIVLVGPSTARYRECLLPWVIHRPEDTAWPYKMIFNHRLGPGHGAVDPEHYGLHIAWSRDGLHWSDPRLAVPGKHDNPPSMVWYEPEKKYLAVMRAQARHPKLGGYWRVTGVSESRDFLNWTPMKTFVLTDDQDGYPYVQFHDIQLTVYGDVIVGMATVMHLTREGRENNKTSRTNIQLVTTRNGWQWHRVADRAVFIDNGPGEYDSESVMAKAGMILKDDMIQIYYAGSSFKLGKGGDEKKQRPLCLATLPADRILALIPDGSKREGMVVTKPFYTRGRTLLVNAQLEKPGDLQAEILDRDGKVISGYSRRQVRVVAKDKLRYRLVWGPRGKSWGDLPSGQPVAIRFFIKRGTFYAFQIMR
jgi:hypothetical protein